MDAIIPRAGRKRFSGHLKIIRPLKLAKNTLILHVLPAISAVCYFLGFFTQVQFWMTSGPRIELFPVAPENRHGNISSKPS